MRTETRNPLRTLLTSGALRTSLPWFTLQTAGAVGATWSELPGQSTAGLALDTLRTAGP
jgi:hypothetical protein